MTESGAWLIVGLGNPGAKYAGHRHNVGFMALDHWLGDQLPLPPMWRSRWQAEVFSFSMAGSRCVLAKPQTFMNNSGESVAALMQFHQTPPERLVVLHDELDFELGRVALKQGGGHGGHNGLRDIIDRTGQKKFLRIRLGIGRPARGSVSRWVLSDFSDGDSSVLDEELRTSTNVLNTLLAEGPARAMNEFNTAAAGGTTQTRN